MKADEKQKAHGEASMAFDVNPTPKKIAEDNLLTPTAPAALTRSILRSTYLGGLRRERSDPYMIKIKY